MVETEELFTEGLYTHPTLQTQPLKLFLDKKSGRVFGSEIEGKGEDKISGDFGDLLARPINEEEYKKMRVDEYLKALEQEHSIKRRRMFIIGSRWVIQASESNHDLFWSWFKSEDVFDLVW